jgi:hypothetical protein
MAFVRKLRSQVESGRQKMGFVERLRGCVEENRNDEREISEYLTCMQIYKQVAERPFSYTREYRQACEEILDDMLWSAIADQRKHRVKNIR